MAALVPFLTPKNAHVDLRAGRALARAELGGSSVGDTFSLADAKGTDSLSHAEFWEVSACIVVTRALLGYIEWSKSEQGFQHFRACECSLYRFLFLARAAKSTCTRQHCCLRHSCGTKFSIVHLSLPALLAKAATTSRLTSKKALFLGKHPLQNTYMNIPSLCLTPYTHRLCVAWEACRAW